MKKDDQPTSPRPADSPTISMVAGGLGETATATVRPMSEEDRELMELAASLEETAERTAVELEQANPELIDDAKQEVTVPTGKGVGEPEKTILMIIGALVLIVILLLIFQSISNSKK